MSTRQSFLPSVNRPESRNDMLSAGNTAPGYNAPPDVQQKWFFGLPSRDKPTNPYLQHSEETQSFADAYTTDQNGNPFLNAVMISGITKANHWHVQDMFPWKLSNSIEVSFSVVQFNNAVPSRVPNEGVSRLLSVKRDVASDHLRRYGLASQLEFEFWASSMGREHYDLNMKQTAHGCVEVACYGAMIAGINCPPDPLLPRKNQSGITRDKSALDQAIQQEIDDWSIIQKSRDGFDQVRRRLRQEVFSNTGEYPDMYVYPNRTTDYIKAATKDVSYSQSGLTVKDSGIDIRDIGGGVVKESRPFKTGDNGEEDDPLFRSQTVGGRFHHLNTYCKNFKPGEYTTDHMSQYIHDEPSDTFLRMGYEENVRYTGLYDNWNSSNPTLNTKLGVKWMSKYPTWGALLDQAGVLRNVIEHIRAAPARTRQEFLTLAGKKPPAISIPLAKSTVPVRNAVDPTYNLRKLHRPVGLSVSEVILTGLHASPNSQKLNAAEQQIKYKEINDKVIVNDVYGSNTLYALLPNNGPNDNKFSPDTLAYGLANYAIILYDTKLPSWITRPNTLRSIITGVDMNRILNQLAAFHLGALIQFPDRKTEIDASIIDFLQTPETKKAYFDNVLKKYSDRTQLYSHIESTQKVLHAAYSYFVDAAKLDNLINIRDAYIKSGLSNSGGIVQENYYEKAVTAAHNKYQGDKEDLVRKARSAVNAVGEILRLKGKSTTSTFDPFRGTFEDLYSVIARNDDTTEKYISEFQFMVLIYILASFMIENEKFQNGRDEVLMIIHTLMESEPESIVILKQIKQNVQASGYLNEVADCSTAFTKNDANLLVITTQTTLFQKKKNQRFEDIRQRINNHGSISGQINSVYPGSSSSSSTTTTIPIIHSQQQRELEQQFRLVSVDSPASEDIFQDVFDESAKVDLLDTKTFIGVVKHVGTRQSLINDTTFYGECCSAWFSGNNNTAGVDEILVLTTLAKAIVSELKKSSVHDVIRYLIQSQRIPCPRRTKEFHSSARDPEPYVKHYTNEEIKAMLFVMSTNSGAFWKWCIQSNIPVGIGMIGFRPHKTFLMGSGFALLGHGKTGYTYYMNPNFQVGHNVAQKTIFTHFTYWSGTIIERKRNIAKAINMICEQYLGGGGIRVFDPFVRVDVDNARNGIFKKDVFYVPCLVNQTFASFHTDMSGSYHKNWNADADCQNSTNIHGLRIYSDFWGLTNNVADPLDQQLYGTKRRNTLCMQEIQKGYVQAHGKPEVIEIDKTHNGPDVYAGCAKIRRGKESFYEKQNYDCSNALEIRLTA
jgi:hypothetical protein